MNNRILEIQNEIEKLKNSNAIHRRQILSNNERIRQLENEKRRLEIMMLSKNS